MSRDIAFQREMARRHQREAQQGLGSPIISTNLADQRIVAVGRRVLKAPLNRWKTFHDFLWDYLFQMVGLPWFKTEEAKSEADRHPLFVLHRRVVAYLKPQQKGDGQVSSARMTGTVEAYYRLAYHLYLVDHNAGLPKNLLNRLRDKTQFHGVQHELYVAATFVKAGFKITHEDETDSTRSHCEFTAEHRGTGNKFSVEAKAKPWGKEATRMRETFVRALLKQADYPLIAWIAINAPASNWQAGMDVLKDAMQELRDREAKAIAEGQKLPPAYVIVSNHPYLFAAESSDYVASAFADGFKIPDFRIDQKFYSTREIRLTREKHREMYHLLSSMQVHDEIPTTFDGENPELAFTQGPPRMRIGEFYELTHEDRMVTAQLESAVVNVPEKSVYGIYRTVEGIRATWVTPLTPAEVAAYLRHPKTFFGVLDSSNGGKMSDPLDFFDFSRPIYGQTPKEKLLEFMKGASDTEWLQTLSQSELATIYVERLADGIFRQKQLQIEGSFIPSTLNRIERVKLKLAGADAS